MDYVYAVVRSQCQGLIDVVYSNKDTAKEVCHQMNDEHWELMNTPIEYRRKNYETYTVVTIPVDAGEPL